MNTPSTNKNIAIWNEQSLDTWHDIIVSFEYCRFNRQMTPTGGFCLALFNSITNMPHGGGSGYNLGYTPSTATEYCKLEGYGGLESAFLGIGFDSLGRFGLATDLVDGASLIYSNSFAVRNGVSDDYSLLYNSPGINFLDPNLTGFFIDEFLPDSNEEPAYRAVRVVLTKNCTDLKIQLKQNTDEETFTTVYSTTLPERIRSSVKVAIANTTLEPFTEFKIRNFNVAGYPSEDFTQLVDGCTQYIFQPGIMQPSKTPVLPVGREFISVPFQGNLLVYTTDGTSYKLKNTLYGGIKLLGDDGTNIVATLDGSPTINIYRYLGQKMALTAAINTPDGSYPISGDIDGNSLVVCTSANNGTIFAYDYTVDTTSPTIGTWSLTQTIYAADVTSGGGLGLNAAIDGGNLLVSNNNYIVHAFQRNVLNQWIETQTLTCPNTGVTHFGYSLDVQGRDALIGAPYSLKSMFNTTGEGETFHYYLNRNTNRWNPIMAIGGFFNINSVAGNFGESVRLQDNSCIIGSPGEMWRDNDVEENIPNVGRAYVFRKADDGYFTQGTILYPVSSILTKYLFFGQAVNMYGRYAFVAAPYYYSDIIREEKSYINVFDTECIFTMPAPHLPVPLSAVDLVDKGGYIISFINNTYMVQNVDGDPLVNDPGITGQTTSIQVISGNTFSLEVQGYGTDPLYYWWQRNGTFTTPTPVIGLSAIGSTFASLSDGGSYYAIVSNLFGSVSSSLITLEIYYLPYFITQPISKTVTTGANTSLTAVAAGYPTPTYQWQKDEGFGFLNLPAPSSDSILILNNNVTTGWQYRCVATNAAGSTDSGIATITVTP